jgi:hypothetical protein
MILDFIKRRYDSEIEKITSLDSRASNLIGFVSVVVGLIIGGGAFKISIIAGRVELWFPFFGGIILLLLSIFFGLASFRTRNWAEAPDFNTLFNVLTDPVQYDPNQYNYDNILKANAQAMIEATTNTSRRNRVKIDHMDRSWWFLIFGLISVGIFLGIFAFGGGAIQNDRLR